MAAAFRTITALAPRIVLLFALWVLISEARVQFLLPGLVATALAAAASARLSDTSGRRPLPRRLLSYTPHFLWRSLAGGIDVAARVLHPHMPLNAALLDRRLRLRTEGARSTFCNAITLMPGTLVARLEGRDALVHVLSDDPAMRRTLDDEEDRIAVLFGEEKRGSDD